MERPQKARGPMGARYGVLWVVLSRYVVAYSLLLVRAGLGPQPEYLLNQWSIAFESCAWVSDETSHTCCFRD